MPPTFPLHPLKTTYACAQLRSLSLHGILGITPRALDALVTGPGDVLEEFDVNGCSGIPADMRARDALRARMPRLRVTTIHT